MAGNQTADARDVAAGSGVQTLRPSSEWIQTGDRWCVLHVLRGAGYWLAEVHSIMLEPGDALLVPAPMAGRLRASRLSNLTVGIWCHAETELRALLATRPGGQAGAVPGVESRTAVHFSATSPEAIELTTLVTQQHRGSRGAAVSRRVLEWLMRRIDPAHVPVPIGTRATAGNARLRAWLATLEREELGSLSVVELARRFGCSGRHLSRLFHLEFGMSVRQRQIAIRMEVARELLRDDRLRIIEVALGCGYRNLGLFNAAFKTAHGVTPSQWRRQALVAHWREEGRNGAINGNQTRPAGAVHPLVTAGTGACYALS